MDRSTQAQHNTSGSHSGIFGNNNVFDSSNIITLPAPYDGSNFGYTAPGPYRLIPCGRNGTFTGRKNLIESVKRFSEHKGHSRVALHGLGGSGKTQIALEYAYQRASESDCNVFWVQGSGVLNFCEGFGAIAQRVRIPSASVRMDEEAFLLSIRKWLEGPSSHDWILVIDNADNEADFSTKSPIAKYIPQGTKGTLLFTTRSRQVALRQGCEMIEVGNMEKEEAEELFSKCFGNYGSLGEEEKQAIGMILDTVHHLPLAVVGSAAFMIATAIPPSTYRTILQENGERTKALLSHQFCDPRREADASESILGTYFVTFNRITQQMPLAANLLQLMAFFDSRNIPEELLSKCGLEGMDDPVRFRLAIGKLWEFSFITITQRENRTFYDLHGLVQLSLQVYPPAEKLDQSRAAALQAISRVFPRDRNEWRCIGPAYVPHALAVTKDSTGPIAEELCFRIGQYFLDNGSYNHAETQFRRCIALRKEGQEYDWDDEGHQRFMLLGEVNTHQDRHGESEKMYRSALDESDKAFGPDHHNTLRSLSSLAAVLEIEGKYEESEKVNRRALEGYERVYGPDHPTTLECLANLTMVQQKQGKPGESVPVNENTPQRVAMEPDRTGPQPICPSFTCGLARRFLRVLGFGKDDRPAT